MTAEQSDVKTLAEWKRRMVMGATYFLTYSEIRKPPVTAPEIRKIVRVGKTFVCYESAELNNGKVGWLHFPKASEFKPIPGGWEFHLRQRRDGINFDVKVFRYQWEAQS